MIKITFGLKVKKILRQNAKDIHEFLTAPYSTHAIILPYSRTYSTVLITFDVQASFLVVLDDSKCSLRVDVSCPGDDHHHHQHVNLGHRALQGLPS